MSKAEERACQYTGYCRNKSYSDFLNGYQQAEKDLELTWKDIESIHILMAHQEVTPILWKCGNEAFYQEVLKRFKILKK